MKKWLWIMVFYVLFMILIITFLEFKALDKKIQQAIDRQNEINCKMYEIAETQARAIRVLETDTTILMNIIVNGDYCKEEE